ncbi:MAG: hypothetical protein ABI440_05490 [Casimicrobiaceae bacterium]
MTPSLPHAVAIARLARGTLAATFAVIAGCAGAPVDPHTPRDVPAQRVAPWEGHEDCVDVVSGERIDFRFEATASVDFDLYYREGVAVVIPLSRVDTRSASGIFEVEIPGHYCLAWKAGVAGAWVDYHIRVQK